MSRVRERANALRAGRYCLFYSTARLPMIRSLLQRAGLLALVASLVVPAVLAQGQQPQQPAPQVELSDREVQMVAELAVDIEDVRTEYRSRLQDGGSEDARALQKEMQSEITQTIEDFDGMTPERYDNVMRAAQADDELKQRILTQIKKEQEKRKESDE